MLVYLDFALLFLVGINYFSSNDDDGDGDGDIEQRSSPISDNILLF